MPTNFLPIIAASFVCLSPYVTDEPSYGIADALSASERQAIKARYEKVLATIPQPESNDANATNAHSARGDAFFYLGQFQKAVREYELMVTVNPDLDTSHWRLGIAYFFADKPENAVAQFEKYRSFDDVDRENGIWRYLSQFKATDGAKAKKELIRYEKDDRQPFPTVYRLFDGTVTPEQALSAIPKDIDDRDRDARLFYTELYIGMHMVVKNRSTEAQMYLAGSVKRKWPRTAGYGPNFMWHVGRLQLDLLTRKAKDSKK